MEPIAIIGIGCRFPGADSPEAFWELLRNGVDAIREVPPERFDIDAYYDPEQGKPGKINSRWGGFLEEVDGFDANFFGIAPREVMDMDPQQRLLLEVAWQAVENAGIPADKLVGSSSGVFVGISTSDYKDSMVEAGVAPTAYSGTGNALSLAANRLSYVLDLRGPSVSVDTACSSSLIAIHLACQSLRTGACSTALAGGVNLILAKTWTMAFSQAHMLSSDGRCKTFDASANGYVRSEGVGVVVLKRLSDAVQDGDPIVAVIRGTAANQDGHSNGVTVPNGGAQQEVIRIALDDAELNPADIDYVEAHGTGTPVGDPIEIDALKAVLLEDRPADRECVIGSSKTNIGHMEAASGMAGLIKAAMVLQRREVPPHLHLQELNPRITLTDTPMIIATERYPLESSRPLRAGVNGFGFGGANCHVVLEEAPPRDTAGPSQAPSRHLLTLSAKTPEALRDSAAAFETFLSNATDLDIRDVCYTTATRRTHHNDRLAIVADSRESMVEALQSFGSGESTRDVIKGSASTERGKTAFVFSGMGTQWVGMGRQLMQENPVFRAAIERCDTAILQEAGWSLLDELAADDSSSHLSDIGILQPVLFAIGLGLADVWRSYGIEPDAVLGHSVGEVVAAHVSGALSLQDAVRVVCRRGEALRLVSGKGAMLSVPLPADEAGALIVPYGTRVSVGVMNSPTTTVLSGEPEAIGEIAATLQGQGLTCHKVKADVAFHSAQMDLLQDAFFQALDGIQPRPETLQIYSTVTGTEQSGESFDRSYWISNLRAPVAFARTVQNLLEDGFDTFIEVGPHPVLLYPLGETTQLGGYADIIRLPSLRRNEPESAVLLQSLGALYAAGALPRWDALYPSGGNVVSLPTYPFQHERFWLDLANGKHSGVPRRAKGYAALGLPVLSAGNDGKSVWEVDLSFDTFPYLVDHVAWGSAILPAAFYAEMAWDFAAEVKLGAHVIESLIVHRGLVLTEDVPVRLQMVATPDGPDAFELQYFASDVEGPDGGSAWQLHAAAILRKEADASARVPAEGFQELEERLTLDVSGPEHYDDMLKRALQYGPAFQGIESSHWLAAESVSRVRIPEQIAGDLPHYRLHPAILDTCLQAGAGLIPLEPYLPVSFQQLRLYDVPQNGLWVYAHRLTDDKYQDSIDTDVFLCNGDGQLVAEIRGLRVQSRAGSRDEMISEWLYQTRWETVGSTGQDMPQSLPAQLRGEWLIFGGHDGLGQQLASLLRAHGQICTSVSHGDAFRKADSHHFEINPAVPEDFHRLLQEALSHAAPLVGIIHLWGIADHSTSDSRSWLLSSQDAGPMAVMHLTQALGAASVQPHVWVVTRGAQPIDGIDEPGVAQAPLVGVARVLANEHPELKCKAIDLDSASAINEVEGLFIEMLTQDGEREVALRGATRYVPRLHRYEPTGHEGDVQTIVSADQPFRLGTKKPGILDNLRLQQADRRCPEPGQVEIMVKATGLNFRDVMSAMGILPGYPEGLGPLGYECAGTITAVGEGVEGLQLGDDVIALAYHAFASYVTTDARLVVRKPGRLSFVEAATIPITFLTAHYGLNHLARLERGERILIHAAAGGVGMAAIQIAQSVGAEIFATAGSPEKRELLRSLGVQHVMNSRSLDFVGEIMEITAGAGVDVVLNSLSGDFIPKSLSVLGPYGRFVELGRTDIYQNSKLGLLPFQRNLSFFAVDLDKLYSERPGMAGKLFEQVIALIECNTFQPLPHTVYPVSDAESAFRQMAQAKHVGKIVVSLEAESVTIHHPPTSRCRSDGTYLVTGGLGGLGLHIAQWLASEGAGSIVLIGRRPPGQEAHETIERLKRSGCRVATLQADVAREEDVAAVLAEIRTTMPPLRGIVHAAGIVDPAPLLSLDRDRFERTTAPKVLGGWNLHCLTKDDPLDFFVVFSSISSVFGLGGQANYVAGNHFLDCLASYRRAHDLPALSIAWGPWSESGMAATRDYLNRFASQGLMGITPRYGLAALSRVFDDETGCVTVAPIDWQRRAASGHASPTDPFLAQIAEDIANAATMPSAHAGATLDTIKALPPDARQAHVEEYLREQVSKVLGVSLRKISADQELMSLGLDSLMAVELRHRINADLGTDIDVTEILGGITIEQLASSLLARLSSDSASTNQEVTGDFTAADVGGLSDEQVAAALADLLG